MRKPLLAGNWKMFKTIPEALELVNSLKKNLSDVSEREVLICPAFTALSAVSQSLKGANIVLGAQNMYTEVKGAFTGEISPVMLLDAGCKYVIIGHSERRQYFGETDDSVSKKIKAAFENDLVPVACIGESLAERESGNAFKVIEKQIREGIKELTEEQAKSLVIAYEPVWAIGTGRTATKEQAEEIHAYIRKLYEEIYGKTAADTIRILYGGSVKPDNISELMKQPNIDGCLVGGASLDAESFSKIVCYK